jgi:hypothetical protein
VSAARAGETLVRTPARSGGAFCAAAATVSVAGYRKTARRLAAAMLPYRRQTSCATASGRPLFRRRDPSCVRRLLAADDRRIAPAVEATIAEHGKIRLVCLIGHDFDDYEGGAVWEDLKLGVHHPASIERAAIVTDARCARPAVKLLGVLWPGQARAFRSPSSTRPSAGLPRAPAANRAPSRRPRPGPTWHSAIRSWRCARTEHVAERLHRRAGGRWTADAALGVVCPSRQVERPHLTHDETMLPVICVVGHAGCLGGVVADDEDRSVAMLDQLPRHASEQATA